MTYNRKDLAVQVNIRTLKGYTMREIGALEDRIRKLEYYTVLNALSLDTKTLSVRDENNNLERFKNGIFADPFNDHTLGRVEDREYSINMSAARSIALPRYEPFIQELKYQNTVSTNVKTVGRLALIDYDTERLAGNPYASIYRNCLESFYSFVGKLDLYPNYDSGKSVLPGAPQNINIDIAGAFKSLLATGIAQHIDTEVGRPKLTSSTSSTSGLTTTTVNQYSQTTTTTVKDIGVDVQKVPINIGPVVQDVSILPYMRSRIVGVVARGLKPNTTVHCFFDNQPVDQYCAQSDVNPAYADLNNKIDNNKLSSLTEAQANLLVLPRDVLGGPFKTDSDGTIYLSFIIPENTFRTGDRVFIVTNVDDIKAKDAIVTKAEGTYTANALSVKTTDISFNVLQPSFRPTSTSNSVTKTWSTTTTETREDRPSRPSTDPVAETFLIQDSSEVTVPGVYLASIGVYFKSKSPTLGITMFVCETTSGVVDSARIITKCHLEQDVINTSQDSSTETIFTFDHPALLQTDRTYAFFLVPDGNNPDYEIWISEVGGIDKLTGAAINVQPFAGIMYVSSNGRSWTPVQSQDIKFNLYRARFKYGTATAVFSNETEDFFTIANTSTTTSGVGISIGHAVYAANSANLAQTLVDTTINPFGIVSRVDVLNNLMYIERSNGLFSNTTFKNLRIYNVNNYANTQEIVAANLVANTELYQIEDLSYHQLAPKLVVAEPIGTTATFKYYGTSNSTSVVGSYIKDTNPVTLNLEELYEYTDYERVYRSFSNQTAQGGFGVQGNATYEVTLRTDNNYVSPVIDLGTKAIKYIRNIVSANNLNEHTRYGYALNRYVSQVVALATASEDIKVYVTAYKPAGSEVEVYVKFKSAGDTEPFDDKAWTKLEYAKNESGTNTGSLKSNSPGDYKELIYTVPRYSTFSANVSISGTTMTVNEVDGAANTPGSIGVGSPIVGPSVLSGTYVTALGTGTGGTGTYTINNSQGPLTNIQVKAPPYGLFPANAAYSDTNAYDYSGGKIVNKTLTYFDNSQGLQTSFSQFAIKIVLLADDPVKVPNMRDVRSIALMI